MYNLAKKYYEHHKDLKIPSRYKTINGYECNEEGIDLVEADEIDENGERIVSESVEDADSYLSLSMSLDGADLADIEDNNEKIEYAKELVIKAFDALLATGVKSESEQAIMDINGNSIGRLEVSINANEF